MGRTREELEVNKMCGEGGGEVMPTHQVPVDDKLAKSRNDFVPVKIDLSRARCQTEFEGQCWVGGRRGGKLGQTRGTRMWM